MYQGEVQGRMATVHFTGTRSQLFGILLRGYILMLPTIGVYRFWLTTWKRRFFWSNTQIDGDALEYTGNPLQLLIGFLFAVGIFLPLYGVFFYLNTQSPETALLGLSVVGGLLWFLSGYAIYRARDFRLSRTLWRGIRFDQGGSAWGYAFRRFGWSILMVVTLGLVYPLMAGNLWRYRYNHTWFGDRQFSFTGRAGTIAGPYYLTYFIVAALVGVTAAYTFGTKALTLVDGVLVPDGTATFLMFLTALVCWVGTYYYRARETSRMMSSIRIGDCQVTMRLRARSLFGQFVVYGLACTGAVILFAMVAGIVVQALFAEGPNSTTWQQVSGLMQGGTLPALLLILSYLVVIGTFSLLGEVFLGCGYWMLLCQGATISNADSLRNVRARGEDRSLAGEGLADALNVGAY
jgi:uncharacterized membrane protein YjgN (DUF898 family)